MYGCESWTLKKAEHRRIGAFAPWCWRRLLRIPWNARRSNQSILKEISPEYPLEGLRLKPKLQYFGHLMWRTDPIGKDPIAGKGWRQEEKGTTEDELVMDREAWHATVHGIAKSQTRVSDWTELKCLDDRTINSPWVGARKNDGGKQPRKIS